MNSDDDDDEEAENTAIVPVANTKTNSKSKPQAAKLDADTPSNSSWRECVDPNTKKKYFWNPVTGATAWKKPLLAAPLADPVKHGKSNSVGSNEAKSDPGTWKKCESSEGQYYWNQSTGETRWDLPTEKKGDASSSITTTISSKPPDAKKALSVGAAEQVTPVQETAASSEKKEGDDNSPQHHHKSSKASSGKKRKHRRHEHDHHRTRTRSRSRSRSSHKHRSDRRESHRHSHRHRRRSRSPQRKRRRRSKRRSVSSSNLKPDIPKAKKTTQTVVTKPKPSSSDESLRPLINALLFGLQSRIEALSKRKIFRSLTTHERFLAEFDVRLSDWKENGVKAPFLLKKLQDMAIRFDSIGILLFA